MIPRVAQLRRAPGPSGGPCRARSAGPTGPAPSAAAPGRAPRPTTCDVAAVPRNWQPPPGLAQARQPSSAASSSVISPWAKRAPIVCTLPASSPSRRRQRHAAGHEHARQVVHRRPGPSSSPAGPCRRSPRRARPARVGSERISRRKTMRRVVAVRQAVHHAGRALRAAVARVGDEAGERDAPQRAAAPRPPPASSRPTSQCPVW